MLVRLEVDEVNKVDVTDFEDEKVGTEVEEERKNWNKGKKKNNKMTKIQEY